MGFFISVGVVYVGVENVVGWVGFLIIFEICVYWWVVVGEIENLVVCWINWGWWIYGGIEYVLFVGLIVIVWVVFWNYVRVVSWFDCVGCMLNYLVCLIGGCLLY